MRTDPDHHIVALDRLTDGMFFYFKDGKQGFFSDELLHRLLEHEDVRHKRPYLDFGEGDPAREG